MKLFSAFPAILLLLASTNAGAVVEPDTNGIMCSYVRKLKRMNWVYRMEDPDLPTDLGQGGQKIAKAISKANNGNVLASMNLVKNSIRFSDMFPGSLSEALSILASGYSRWVAKAFVALAESEDEAPTFSINKANNAIAQGIVLRNNDYYKASVVKFTMAVRIIVTSPLFIDKFLDKPNCDETTGMPAWLQLGQDLDGKEAGDLAGRPVSLSQDGTVVAVGATEATGDDPFDLKGPGYVTVYRLDKALQSWTQMGQQLVGKEKSDHFGISVSLNAVGNILAIGIAWSNAVETHAGQVRAYKYNSATFLWDLLGKPIDGEAKGDNFGNSVSLSESGLVLAVATRADFITNHPHRGSVRLFQFQAGIDSWQQLGQTLVSPLDKDQFGTGLSLSSSGMTVAVSSDGRNIHPYYVGGTAYSRAGQVSVYRYNTASSSWTPMGEPIYGQDTGDLLGRRVSLDDAGLTLAVSASSRPQHLAVVFDYDPTTSSWKQRGQENLMGEAPGDILDSSVSLSQDGNVFAVGGFFYEEGSTRLPSGIVRIFQFKGKAWIQVGSDIDGEETSDSFGSSVSLSGNGMVVAGGAPYNSGGGNGELSGHARVFSLSHNGN